MRAEDGRDHRRRRRDHGRHRPAEGRRALARARRGRRAVRLLARRGRRLCADRPGRRPAAGRLDQHLPGRGSARWSVSPALMPIPSSNLSSSRCRSPTPFDPTRPPRVVAAFERGRAHALLERLDRVLRPAREARSRPEAPRSDRLELADARAARRPRRVPRRPRDRLARAGTVFGGRSRARGRAGRPRRRGGRQRAALPRSLVPDDSSRSAAGSVARRPSAGLAGWADALATTPASPSSGASPRSSSPRRTTGPHSPRRCRRWTIRRRSSPASSTSTRTPRRSGARRSS